MSKSQKPGPSRRGFLIGAAAITGARALPNIAAVPARRRILTLVYDKAMGSLRAVERVVWK